ncbi:MAG: 3-keto-5-aminohexanoate cleavage enzyme [Gammaproteobacteria bacterium]|jgi:3-keto-5-aminohexanoate cleavage enzyme
MTQPSIIMVAPNGARKTHKDHKHLPVSIAETVEEAKQCFLAGATVLHGHVRGSHDEHLLDAGLYQELMSEMKTQVPDMVLQVTTEAVGIYTPPQQIDCVKNCHPEFISMGLREITEGFQSTQYAIEFFNWCDEHHVRVQHILYDDADLQQFLRLRDEGVIPSKHNCVLFVLGRYSVDFQSTPDDLTPFLNNDIKSLDWFTCAFGHREQDCVLRAIEEGGHARVGFENNLYLANGEIAESTSELVITLKQVAQNKGIVIANGQQTRGILGLD